MKQKIERLRSLMEKATAGDLTTAERAQDEFIECPICLGAGEVEARDYCNIDHKALGVQFYGIGPEFGTHEALWSEVMKNLPDLLFHIDALEARVEEAETIAGIATIPDVAGMAERLEAAERALAEAVKERDALRSASTIIRQRDEAVEVLKPFADLDHEEEAAASLLGARDGNAAVRVPRRHLRQARAFLAKMGEK